MENREVGPNEPHEGHEHTVTIIVNKKSVTVPAPKATGKQIKQAAIDAGVNIKVEFVLYELLANGRRKTVGDEDEVTVNPESKFVAVDADDNS